MKTWEWSEIYLSREMAVDSSRLLGKWRSLYLRYGGSARHLLAWDENTVELHITDAFNAISIQSLLQPKKLLGSDMAHYLIELFPGVDDETGLVQRDSRKLRIVSRSILDSFLKFTQFTRVSNLQRNRFPSFIYQEFCTLNVDPETAPTAGSIFELAAHRYLSTKSPSDGDLKLRSLPTSLIDSLDLREMTEVDNFGRVRTAESLDPSKYYYPTSTRFPGVDSFVLRRPESKDICSMVMFQVTSASHHPVELDFMIQLEKKSPGVKFKWEVVFVVPKDKEAEFKEQPLQYSKQPSVVKDWEERIWQYVTGIEEEQMFGALYNTN